MLLWTLPIPYTFAFFYSDTDFYIEISLFIVHNVCCLEMHCVNGMWQLDFRCKFTDIINVRKWQYYLKNWLSLNARLVQISLVPFNPSSNILDRIWKYPIPMATSSTSCTGRCFILYLVDHFDFVFVFVFLHHFIFQQNVIVFKF